MREWFDPSLYSPKLLLGVIIISVIGYLFSYIIIWLMRKRRNKHQLLIIQTARTQRCQPIHSLYLEIRFEGRYGQKNQKRYFLSNKQIRRKRTKRIMPKRNLS